MSIIVAVRSQGKTSANETTSAEILPFRAEDKFCAYGGCGKLLVRLEGEPSGPWTRRKFCMGPRCRNAHFNKIRHAGEVIDVLSTGFPIPVDKGREAELYAGRRYDDPRRPPTMPARDTQIEIMKGAEKRAADRFRKWTENEGFKEALHRDDRKPQNRD